MATKEAFVAIKDHKDNFEVNPTYRLIDPAKKQTWYDRERHHMNVQIGNTIAVN